MRRPAVARNVWERLGWLWPAWAGVVGVAHLGFGLAARPEGGSPWPFLGLTMAFGLWYGLSLRRDDDWWQSRPKASASHLLVGWWIWLALIAVQPASLVLAGVLYPTSFLRLPIRLAIVAAAVVTATFVAFTLPEEGPPDAVVLLAAAALFGGAVGLGSYIHSLITQSQDRQRLVEELRRATADLVRAERRAGMLAERNRLAGDIHDSLAQDLASIAMQVEAARLALDREARDVGRHLDLALDAARRGLAEARRLVWALRPEELGRQSLPESLHQLAEQWSRSTHAAATTEITGRPRLVGPLVEATILRAAQEALHNIEKHAHASRVSLTLSYMPDLIVLDVNDNGVGFRPPAPAPSVPGSPGSGYGLGLLRERVADLGGRLTIESTPGEGTTLAVSIPHSAATHEESQPGDMLPGGRSEATSVGP